MTKARKVKAMRLLEQSRVAPSLKTRSRCRWCDNPLKPLYDYDEKEPYWHAMGLKHEEANAAQRKWRREHVEWTGRYSHGNFFCTVRCGLNWANRMLKGNNNLELP